MNLTSLIEFDRLAREDGKKYFQKRFLYENLMTQSGRHFTGIVGPRGAGKTILLKQMALSHPASFYLSLDTFQEDLFETVKAIHTSMKAELFLLDEVHMHAGFEGALKKIYDFLAVRVIFTSSMALALYQSSHDLSRRVVLKTLYPFSLREYLFFKYNRELPALTFSDILEKNWDRSIMESGSFFSEYIRGSLMPFALEEANPFPIFENILQTVIYKDIAKISQISLEEMEILVKLLAFIGKSGIDGINYSSLSKNLGITKYKAEQYTGFLEEAFLLHRILPEGTAVLKEPKIVMALPYRLLYRPYEEAIGGLREDFFVEALKACGKQVHYLKSIRGEKTPDYVVSGEEKVVFEIGGRGKGRQQFKGFQASRKIILSDSYETEGLHRPLFLLGLLANPS